MLSRRMLSAHRCEIRKILLPLGQYFSSEGEDGISKLFFYVGAGGEARGPAPRSPGGNKAGGGRYLVTDVFLLLELSKSKYVDQYIRYLL